jgi:outer membrane protein assembly factor BamE (lipoprotein component of BamABCDE complex)
VRLASSRIVVSRTGRRLLLAAGVAAVAACTPTIDTRGNFPLEEVVEQIKVGGVNKDQVTDLLGTPSTVALFDDEVWYYIGERTETVAFFSPTVLERKILAIRFDQTGRVTNLERLDLDDARSVALVGRVTPTKGREFTILQQVIGNVGRFSNSGKKGGQE